MLLPPSLPLLPIQPTLAFNIILLPFLPHPTLSFNILPSTCSPIFYCLPPLQYSTVYPSPIFYCLPTLQYSTVYPSPIFYCLPTLQYSTVYPLSNILPSTPSPIFYHLPPLQYSTVYPFFNILPTTHSPIFYRLPPLQNLEKNNHMVIFFCRLNNFQVCSQAFYDSTLELS